MLICIHIKQNYRKAQQYLLKIQTTSYLHKATIYMSKSKVKCWEHVDKRNAVTMD